MTDDDYPNFGNAWTSTAFNTASAGPPPGESAWNPAHRPDSDQRQARTTSTVDADFFHQLSEPATEQTTEEVAMDEVADKAQHGSEQKAPSITVNTRSVELGGRRIIEKKTGA